MRVFDINFVQVLVQFVKLNIRRNEFNRFCKSQRVVLSPNQSDLEYNRLIQPIHKLLESRDPRIS